MNKRQQQFLAMVQKNLHLDADQSIFFARELEIIDRTQYEAKYPDLEAELLLPVRKQVPLGPDQYTWRLFDGQGQAIPSSGGEDAVPMVDVNGDEQSEKLQSWALGYGWTLDELDKARFTGMPLDTMRAMRTRRGLAEKLNTMALTGYSVKGIKGLFNLASTLTYSTPNGVSGFSDFERKTSDECLTDLYGMVDGIPNATIDIEGGANKPMRLLLPKKKVRVLSTKRVSIGGTPLAETVLEHFKKQRPNITVMGANYLDTAGSGSGTRAVVYDPQMVEWITCLPFQQLPVEQKGMRFNVPCRCRGGGVFTQYPKSVLYADGI